MDGSAGIGWDESGRKIGEKENRGLSQRGEKAKNEEGILTSNLSWWLAALVSLALMVRSKTASIVAISNVSPEAECLNVLNQSLRTWAWYCRSVSLPRGSALIGWLSRLK